MERKSSLQPVWSVKLELFQQKGYVGNLYFVLELNRNPPPGFSIHLSFTLEIWRVCSKSWGEKVGCSLAQAIEKWIAAQDNKVFNIICSLQLALFHMFLPSLLKDFGVGLETICCIRCNHHGHFRSMDASSLWFWLVTPCRNPCSNLEIWWLHLLCGLYFFELVTDNVGWYDQSKLAIKLAKNHLRNLWPLAAFEFVSTFF